MIQENKNKKHQSMDNGDQIHLHNFSNIHSVEIDEAFLS